MFRISAKLYHQQVLTSSHEHCLLKACRGRSCSIGLGHLILPIFCRDGLVRIAFTRKNKTLGAIFRQSRTLQLLEANHAVLQVRMQLRI